MFFDIIKIEMSKNKASGKSLNIMGQRGSFKGN